MKNFNYYFSLLVVLFIFVGCSKENKNTNNERNAEITNIYLVKDVIVEEGFAPNFTWVEGINKTVDFKSNMGSVTLVNFWATWCGPCKKELPDLVEISKEMTENGVKVIGISTDRGSNILAEVSEFLKEYKVTYTNILDDGRLAESFGNIRGLPTTFLIDKKGEIADKYLGIRTKEFFVEQINNLLQ